MVRSYVAETRLSPHHMAQLGSRGSTFISKKDLEQEGGAIRQLVFDKLKDLNRYHRNLAAGKKFLLKTDHLAAIKDMAGGSIWTKALKGLKQIGTKMGEKFEVAPGVSINPFTMGYDVGHDHIAPALKKAIKGGKVSTGKQIARAFRKAAPGAKKAARAAGKAAAKAAKDTYAANKDEIQAVGRELASTAVSSAMGDESANVKGATRDAGSKLKHIIARDAGTRAGVFNEANPYQLGQYAPVAAPSAAAAEAVEEMVGEGFVKGLRKIGQKVAQKAAERVVSQGTDSLINAAMSGGSIGQSYGLGGTRLGTSFKTANQLKMERVRSFKQNGGSFRGLGKGFLPLG